MEKKTYKDINPEQFKALSQLSEEVPVVMLNLLKFKDMVPETGVSGDASYKEYMKRAMPFFEQANAEVLFIGKPQSTLIGPQDEDLWDKMLLVRYRSITDFLKMVQAEGYPSDLRKQALEDSRLIHYI